MRRLPKDKRDPLADAQAEIEGLVDGAFGFIADALRNTVESAKIARSCGEMRDAEVSSLVAEIHRIVSALPKAFGRRFWFDAGLIREMCDGLSDNRLFSKVIIPSYDSDWGYARIAMPLSEVRSPNRPDQANVIEILLLPGQDDITNVDLLRYPLIAHELAHSLMFRHDGILIPMIMPTVSRAIEKLRLSAIADRGRARAISQEAIARFANFWTPTPDHKNWSHELVADIISVWLMGPSYLSVFEDLLADGARNPFHIGEVHPPYGVRVKAMMMASARLRLSQYCIGLQEISSGWSGARWTSSKTNQYRSLASVDVIDGLITGTFEFCDQLKLRPWSECMETISSAACDPSICELEPDLLTIAWAIFLRRGADAYEAWESSVIDLLTASSDGDPADSI